jgi:arginyl-tRNA--protein-N-Asp/Glu arginylyltransferase
MKLAFSESQPDYGHYIFPYAIWAFPEPGETPSDFFSRGFLPSSRELDRFYLCRQVRVNLRQYRPSSENRRILRKAKGISARLIARAEFDYTAQRRESYKTYTDIKFGKDTMTYERLDSLFAGRMTSHLLLFTDAASGAEVGTATLYLEPPAVAYYYYAFYDLNYYSRNLGMFMMTSAVALFAERGFDFLYLGSCYSRNALYKTQFAGAEFFNGVRWSADLEELKYLIRRKRWDQHLLESEEYRQAFYAGELGRVVSGSLFRVQIRGNRTDRKDSPHTV